MKQDTQTGVKQKRSSIALASLLLNGSKPEPKDGYYIETFTGGKFFPAAPTFNTRDIAHALSLNCRFNGHVSQFYSVAEHSVLVALLCRELELGDPFEGLMHDATEAYLTDVPSPIKAHLPDWQAMDHRVDLALREHYGLSSIKNPGVKHADWLALFIEAYYLLRSRGEGFLDPDRRRAQALSLIEKDGWKIPCFEPEQAEQAFNEAFDDLRGR